MIESAMLSEDAMGQYSFEIGATCRDCNVRADNFFSLFDNSGTRKRSLEASSSDSSVNNRMEDSLDNGYSNPSEESLLRGLQATDDVCLCPTMTTNNLQQLLPMAPTVESFQDALNARTSELAAVGQLSFAFEFVLGSEEAINQEETMTPTVPPSIQNIDDEVQSVPPETTGAPTVAEAADTLGPTTAQTVIPSTAQTLIETAAPTTDSLDTTVPTIAAAGETAVPTVAEGADTFGPTMGPTAVTAASLFPSTAASLFPSTAQTLVETAAPTIATAGEMAQDVADEDFQISPPRRSIAPTETPTATAI
jgi:hypothetical protein